MNVNCLIGRIGNELEIRYTTTGKTVMNFSLAVQRGYGDNKKTIWVPVIAWEKTAEFIANYFKKGSSIAVVGELDQSTWEDNEGKKHSRLEIIAKNVYFAGEKKEGQQEFRPEEYAIENPLEEEQDELPF